MTHLPDLEAWAVFAKVAEHGSFSRAAGELGLSKATVSKAVNRLEHRIGAGLLHRTSRRLSLTATGQAAAAEASRLLMAGEALEAEARSQAREPRGPVRIAAPMSFGVAHLAPLLPELMTRYPYLEPDLHLSDARVDLVAEGFDLALRIGALADSSLRVRRICGVRLLLVGAPAYFERHGEPAHPRDLAVHRCLGYAHGLAAERWVFQAGERVVVSPAGPMRANNAEAMLPVLRAGLGLAVLPEFLAWPDLAAGRLRQAMPDWPMPVVALHILTPPSGPRPARVEAVAGFLAERLGRAPWAER